MRFFTVPNDFSENGEHNISVLPDYPQVMVSGRELSIIWSKEKIEYWGEEDDIVQAKTVACEMELELKSTAYVKKTLAKELNAIYETLINAGLPHNMSKNALHNGYFSLLHAIVQFEKTANVGKINVIDPKENL